MSALFQNTGPIDIYIRLRTGTAFYLGTAATAPKVTAQPAYLNVPNDLMGRTYPAIRLADGEAHFVSLVANRIDYSGYQIIRDAARIGGQVGPGAMPLLKRGAVMTGVNDFQLILTYSYFGTVLATPDLPPGRIYFSSLLEDYEESTEGTKILDVALTFRCDSILNPVTRNASLYSEAAVDIGVLPAVN